MKKLSKVVGLCLVSLTFMGNALYTTPEIMNMTQEQVKTSVGVKKAESALSSLNLDGYLEDLLSDNIELWQLNAYKDNPNIVESIKYAVEGNIGLSYLKAGDISTYFDVKIDEVENKGHVLSYKHINTGGGTNDIDYTFSSDPSALTDWTGAKELWVYADFSQYGANNPNLRVNIEELDASTGARKSWRVKSGASYIWEGSNKRATATISDNRVNLPKNFKGWVCWPLDTFGMEMYWNSDTCNSTLDLKRVRQFLIAADGDNFSVGTSYYLDNFSIVGDVGGDALPETPRGTEDYTAKTVWSLDNVALNSYTGAVLAWSGEFAGKLLTGLALNYKSTPTKAMYNAGKTLADALVDAQGEDGYLGIFSGDQKYAKNAANWDVWNNYHCIYGLLRWYEMSGDKTYLDAACKGLDCALNAMGGVNGKFYGSFGQEMNMAISHAFIEGYFATGKADYLKTAEHIVLDNWLDHGDWLTNAESGKEYYQSKLPRWEALHTISTLAGLFEATGRTRYYTALEQIWESILRTDVHNDGGFSSGEGACGTPYSDGAVETCCTVAWMALSNEYLKVSKRSTVADELERSYFNGMLGAVMDNRKYVTYDTPMNGFRIPATDTLSFQWNSGAPDFSCCQANLARGLGQIADWAVLTDENTVYVNYYGASNMQAITPAGKRVGLEQVTKYPADGEIELTLSLATAETFNLALRIPGWSNSTTVKVNGEMVDNVTPGNYLNLNRQWSNGDTVEISLDMSVHYWKGEDNYEGFVSVFCGPILMTADMSYSSVAKDAQFTLNDLSNGILVDTQNGLAGLRVKTNTGREIMLVDFASAGRYGSEYRSWLRADVSQLKTINFMTATESIWQNNKTHTVQSRKIQGITQTDNVTAGSVVQLYSADGTVPTVYAGNRKISVKKIDNNRYSFIMPAVDVYIN